MRPSIDSLKRQAKRVAKTTGCSHSHALDQLARAHGFGNWSQLMKNWNTAAPRLIAVDLADRKRMHRSQVVDLEMMINWVAARGGPVAPWRVDLAAKRATLGLVEVGFYETADGGFELNGLDGCDVETEQDCELIEDAYACIARTFAERRRKSHRGRGYYNFKIVSEHRVLSEPCTNDEEALMKFGEQVGTALTLDGDGPSDYLLGWREESLGWVSCTIPVYPKAKLS